MAYVAQQAWILNETLQENILFGRDFDPAKWKTVVGVRSELLHGTLCVPFSAGTPWSSTDFTSVSPSWHTLLVGPQSC